MARGWESKSVEDQQAAAAERHGSQNGKAVSAAERAAAERRTTLLLAKTKALRDLEAARDDRHRRLLEQALDYLETQLNALDPHS